jgi:hypothetical protein
LRLDKALHGQWVAGIPAQARLDRRSGQGA